MVAWWGRTNGYGQWGWNRLNEPVARSGKRARLGVARLRIFLEKAVKRALELGW